MKYFNKALKLAEENGYSRGLTMTCVESVLLDHKFFQCLGKALGWSGKVDMKFINAFGNTLIIEQIQRWEMNQHKFIHHLSEGKDVDEFFKDLLSNGRE